MNYSNLFILLSIIKKNGDIRRLKREGLDYLEIAELTNSTIHNELASYEGGSISLTEKGENKLVVLGEFLKKTNKKNWIDKEIKSKVHKLDKNFIFLPYQNELDF